jgi:hypothetical protein
VATSSVSARPHQSLVVPFAETVPLPSQSDAVATSSVRSRAGYALRGCDRPPRWARNVLEASRQGVDITRYVGQMR